MVPNGAAYSNFPPFANNGTKTPPGGSPESAKYALGMVPADTFPAEWANYLFHGATEGITRLNADAGSMKKEINTVLNNFNITPDATLNNQLLDALTKLKQEAALAAHPVGSLYWTGSAENPAVTFGGGTWSRIKDKFVYAMGDNDTVNATGGAKTVTLLSENLPKHTHSFTPSGTVSSHSHGLNSHQHAFTPKGTIAATSGGSGNKTANESSHTHGFTPSGKIASTSGGTDNKTSGQSNTHNHGYSIGRSGVTGGWIDSGAYKLASSGSYVQEFTTENASSDHTHNAYFTGTAGTTGTGSAHSHAAYFVGTIGVTGIALGDTTATQPTFTGTAGTTGDGGFINTAVDKMPPYICKFCWERTA